MVVGQTATTMSATGGAAAGRGPDKNQALRHQNSLTWRASTWFLQVHLAPRCTLAAAHSLLSVVEAAVLQEWPGGAEALQQPPLELGGGRASAPGVPSACAPGCQRGCCSARLPVVVRHTHMPAGTSSPAAPQGYVLYCPGSGCCDLPSNDTAGSVHPGAATKFHVKFQKCHSRHAYLPSQRNQRAPAPGLDREHICTQLWLVC